MDTKFVFTKAKLDGLPLPEPGKRVTYHDEKVPGLVLRITAGGVRTFSIFKRLPGGSPERKTLGKYPGLTIDAARRQALEALHQLASGTSQKKPKTEVKEERPPTLAEALVEYTERKRRRDGLPLKASTKADYLRLIAPGRQWKRGKSQDGELYPLAGKRIDAITGDDIRELHAALEARCKATVAKRKGDTAKVSRRAVYPLVVLRAALNWHKIAVPDTPFGRAEHDKDSIILPDTPSGANPIPLERVGNWWRIVCSLPDTPVLRYFRFLLLTGCRPGEPLSITVGDCDLKGKRAVLRDTKNRADYVLFLSEQAAAIVEQQAAGKAPGDHLFGDVTANVVKKTTGVLAAATGARYSPKCMRSTFGNIAEILTSAYVLKNLMRHSMQGDVTGAHYIVKGERELRPGAQAVADWIEAEATKSAESA